MNDRIEELGGFSYFQLYAYIVIVCGMSCSSFWSYPMGYFMQEPAYRCLITLPDGPAPLSPEKYAEICTAENICENDPRITDWSIDLDSDKTLVNWQ